MQRETYTALQKSSQEIVFPWYALRIRSGLEVSVARCLDLKGYHSYVPIFKIHQQRSDRLRKTYQVAFPGYIFCRFPEKKRLPVLTTPGVMSILGSGRTPEVVPEEEVEAVRRIVCSDLPAMSRPFLNMGHRVCLKGGPLKGVQGIIEALPDKRRLIVSITLLQRSVSVEVESDWVCPLQVPRRHP